MEREQSIRLRRAMSRSRALVRQVDVLQNSACGPSRCAGLRPVDLESPRSRCRSRSRCRGRCRGRGRCRSRSPEPGARRRGHEARARGERRGTGVSARRALLLHSDLGSSPVDGFVSSGAHTSRIGEAVDMGSAEERIRALGGIATTGELITAGYNPQYLRVLAEFGRIVRIRKGVVRQYRGRSGGDPGTACRRHPRLHERTRSSWLVRA